MTLSLDPVQARVLGVLLEKEATTPDAYPLSLNAVTTACNQKSARDPVMDLDERRVLEAIESLISETLVRERAGAGARVRRFAHRLDSRLFGELEFDAEERAVLCVLLLRGPQTPGEIRSRCARLHAFPDLDTVEAVLVRLARRADGPHVCALAREPGRRELRYRHLFCGDPPQGEAGATGPAPAPAGGPEQDIHAPAPAPAAERIDALERRLAAAEARIRALEERLGAGSGESGPAPG